MQHTQIEIRQPFNLPAVVSVPTYRCLAELETKLQKLTEESLAAAGEVASLQREKLELDYQAELITATSSTFARQAEVRQQLTRFEYRHAAAKTAADRVANELKSLRHEFGFRFFRRQLLNAELALAGQPMEMRAYIPGERPRRGRLIVLTELDECLGWLAVWSGDAKLAEEAAAIQAQLTEARQQQ
ncbi:MAG: hypothetical protein ND866_18360 [Pyrinomonadaceae bacterium]|nr:hypothetical protein [Pyrinomonadaceae bacterium]